MSTRMIIVIAVLAMIAAFFLVRGVRQVKAMRRSLTDVCREEFRLQATRSWQYAALLLGAIVVAFGVEVGIFTIPTDLGFGVFLFGVGLACLGVAMIASSPRPRVWKLAIRIAKISLIPISLGGILWLMS